MEKMTMTLEEAIQTAIAYETRIRDVYREAAEKTGDPNGKRLFSALGDDEAHHIAYLEQQLERWRQTGHLADQALESALPSLEDIEKAVEKLQSRMARDDRKSERQMLSKALALEVETFEFYQKMVDTMPDDSRGMFARFLEIENGHVAIVQAELDYLSRTGFWFDFKEFDME